MSVLLRPNNPDTAKWGSNVNEEGAWTGVQSVEKLLKYSEMYDKPSDASIALEEYLKDGKNPRWEFWVHVGDCPECEAEAVIAKNDYLCLDCRNGGVEDMGLLVALVQ